MSEAMTKEQAEQFFGVVYGGVHHIPGELKPFGHGWKINAYAGIATFDFDILTRLVLHAHDCCVRLEVVQGGPGRIGLAIWQRHTREGGIASRHPTIEQALTDWRKAHPATTDQPKEARHPGYVIGNHWLQTAYDRICAGEDEATVLDDYGVTRTAVKSGAAP